MMTKLRIHNMSPEQRTYEKCLKNWVKVKLVNSTKKNPLRGDVDG